MRSASNGIGMSMKTLLVGMICLLFYANGWAFKVTVDSTKATGSGNYRFLDTLLDAINLKQLNPSGGTIEDTVFFSDTIQRTYRMGQYLPGFAGRIRFVGASVNPDKFPILNHVASDGWNFFESANVSFERLIFTGSERFRTGNTPREQYFKNCVIRNFSSIASFFVIEGSGVSKTVFENCLVSNNVFTRGFIDISNTSTSTAPIVLVINCTFHLSRNIFGTSKAPAVASTTIKNCVFSGNDTICNAFPALKPRITYSCLPDTSFHGAGCRYTGNPYYVKPTGKVNPSDFRLTDSSLARNMGDTAGAPKTDISGVLRSDSTGRRDGGCWDIRDAVKITNQPVSDTTIAGGIALFRVFVTGSPEIKFAWHKKDDTTTLSTTDSLKLTAALQNDGVLYYCVVSNDINTVTTDTVALRVFGKPSITDEPDTTFVWEGDTATFSVAATGGGLQFIWRKNGISISGAQFTTIKLPNTAISDDGAAIVCLVKNIVDSVTSRTVLLRVLPAAVKITSKPSDDSIYEGTQIKLKVTASGKLPISFSWTKIGGTELLSTADTFVKNDVVATDSGTYKCVVSNSTSKDSALIKIGIIAGVAPRITSPVELTETYAKIGTAFTFNAQATGQGSLTYKWLKGNYSTADSIASGTSFTISSLALADSGQYFCIVKNDKSADTSAFIVLHVSSNPYVNPLGLSCFFVDRENVKVSISNCKNIPRITGAGPYSETVGLWYFFDSLPSTISYKAADANYFKLSTSRMAALTGDVFDTIIKVPNTSDDCRNLYFILNPLWKMPDSIIAMVPSAHRKKVFMCDTTIFDNKLDLNLEYTQGSDSVIAKISNLTLLDRTIFSTLTISYRITSNGDTIRKTVTSDSLPGASADIYARILRDNRFAEFEETLTVAVVWRGKLGNYSSVVSKKLVVGKLRPINSAKLKVDSASANAAYISWNFEGTTSFDSIRIYWDIKSITPGSTISGSTVSSMMVDSGVSHVAIAPLQSSQNYFVALQTVKDDVPSFFTKNAIVSFSTKTSTTETVENTITIDSATFNPETNLIHIVWHVDTITSGSAKNLITAITWSTDSNFFYNEKISKNEAVIVDTMNMSNQRYIDLGKNIRFMTTYYFKLTLRKKGSEYWANVVPSSGIAVETRQPLWQNVTFFRDKDTIVAALNELVELKKIGSSVVSVSDTIKAFIPVTLEPGFKLASITGIDFAKESKTDPIRIGIRYDTNRVESGEIRRIRMYQYDSANHVVHLMDQFTIDSVNKRVSVDVRPVDYPLPFILLVDTLPPEVNFLSNIDSTVVPGDVLDTADIEDNIENCRYKLVFWGNNGVGGTSPAAKECDSMICRVTMVIPSDSFSVDRGIKCELFVTDGVNDIVTDISRLVKRPASYPLSLPSMTWTPVMTTALHLERSAEKVLSGLSSKEKWKYDTTSFRFFRWIDTSSGNVPGLNEGTRKWVEYSSVNSSLFELIPGKVFWVKSRKSMVLPMGEGTTVSLKEPYEISLKARDWSDIALPFNINVRLGDIFAASLHEDKKINDSIIVYKWTKKGDKKESRIAAVPKYMPGSVGNDSLSTILNYSAEAEGIATYSLYNLSHKDIILRIPPIPEAFSLFKNDVMFSDKAAKKKSTPVGWSVVVQATTQDNAIPSVVCAFNDKLEKKRSYPVPPSLGAIRLYIEDSEQRTRHGGIIHSKTDGNGIVFPLFFENSGDEPVTCSYDVLTKTKLPEKWSVVIYDPATESIDDNGEKIVSVKAASGVYKVLLVGDSAFTASWHASVNMQFTLLKMRPNPARGEFNIRFSLPYIDIKEVQMTMYDQLGRLVWERSLQGSILHSGMNSILWKPEGRSRLSAGTYIFQILATSYLGKTIGTSRQRIIYFP